MPKKRKPVPASEPTLRDRLNKMPTDVRLAIRGRMVLAEARASVAIDRDPRFQTYTINTPTPTKEGAD